MLHSYIGQRSVPALWACLYYIDQIYFQVLVLEKLGEQRCFFLESELPDELRNNL